jgi:hypothetical protein
MTEPYAVALVVDPMFGDRLSGIAPGTPVWIADTPGNRLAVERHWAQHSGQSASEGVTAFKVDPTGTPEDWCASVLPDVDLHHGRLSHDPPYSVIDVYGVPLTPALRAALGDFGFRSVLARDGGFRAVLSDAAA